jgi:hypothetical protein
VRDCRESFRCIGCMRLGHRERDCRHRPVMVDAPSSDLHSPSHGSAQPPSWAEVVALQPTGGGLAPLWQHPKVSGVLLHVEEHHDTCESRHATIIDGAGINKSVLDQVLKEAFATQLVLFRS